MNPGHYPALHAMVQSEGVCPICMMDMRHTPQYRCENGHTMCHRCRPYYYACSVCHGHLDHVPPDMEAMPDIPPPIHFMPHPMPMPSAPEMDFMENERGRWGPPSPEPDQNLVHCQYAHHGCWVRLPHYLSELHETRCQFRPFLEVEHLPTDLPPGEELVPCAYHDAGCDAMMPPWRRDIHEPLCSFKEAFEAMGGEEDEPEVEPEGDEDPDELVECKLKVYGCLVRMPRRRKATHEEKCNYNKYYREEDFLEEEEVEDEVEEVQEEGEDEEEEAGEEEDLNVQVDCRWAEHGCRIRPKLYRKDTHEEKCNYRMEECSFKENGCEASFFKARRFAHERICEFKD